MSSLRSMEGRGRAGALLALLGVLALAAALLLGDDGGLEPPDALVPVNAGSRDQGDISANNSPSLAMNPRRAANLAIVNRVDSPRYTCGLHVSQDGGTRWSSLDLPIPRGEQPKCFAPDVTFASDGTMYVSYVTLAGTTNEPNAVWLVRSTDGGRTLSAPTRVSGPRAFSVRLTTDPQRPKRVYLTWLQPEMIGLYLFSGSNNRIVVTRSDDGGRRFGKPARASAPERTRVLAPSPAVGPDGALYVLFLDVGDDRLDYEGGHNSSGGPPYEGRFSLVLGRSTDSGATWQESLVDDGVVPTRRFIAFLPPTPSLAVDPDSGRIFVAFEDGRNRPSDVYVWSLARDEARWEGPRRVNDTDDDDRTTQYLPKLAVAPGGRLDVSYYDRRDDPRDVRNHVSVQSSFDGGESFTAHVKVTDRSFDSRIGAGSENGLPDIGSRIALASRPDAVLAAWTDTRAGTVDSNKQDIAFARAAVDDAGGLPDWAQTLLAVAGVGLLLGGAALLVLAARSQAD